MSGSHYECSFRYNHPYMAELNLFTAPQSHLRKVVPQPPWDCTLKDEIFIDTKEQLNKMLEELKEQTEIAVDLEVRLLF